MRKNLVETLLPVWNMSQNELSDVIRWGPYVEKNPKVWKQSTLQHTLSFSIVANVCVKLLKKHVKLDESLIQTAFMIHDLGEGLTRRDITADNKKDEDDLEEYEAFKKAFDFLPEQIFTQYQKAFLLQFAWKNPECFPYAEKILMGQLNANFQNEVLTFRALESWEYIFYPLEMYKQGVDDGLLVRVLERQLPVLKFMALTLPGFRAEIFTYEFEKLMSNHVKDNR